MGDHALDTIAHVHVLTGETHEGEVEVVEFHPGTAYHGPELTVFVFAWRLTDGEIPFTGRLLQTRALTCAEFTGGEHNLIHPEPTHPGPA